MSAEPRFPWRELVETMFRRKLIVAAFAMFGVGLGAWTSFNSAPVYQAEATLLLEVQRGRLTGTGLTQDRVERADLTRQVELLRTRALIRQVLVEEGWTDERAPEPPPFTWKTVLHLLPRPRALANRIYSEIHNIQGQTPLDRYVTRTLRGLTVVNIRGANLIRLGFTSFDPEYAASFLNRLLETHIRRSIELSTESQTRVFLLAQQEEAAQRLEQANANLRAYKERVGMGMGSVDEGQARSLITNLEGDKADAEISMREIRARIDAIDRQLSGQPRDITTGSVVTVNPVLQALQTELASKQVEKTQLLSKYAPGSTVMRDMDAQIARLEEAVAEQVSSTTQTTTALNPAFASLEAQKFDAQVQIEAIQARVEGINERLAETRGALRQAMAVTPELARLQEEVRQASSLYQSYSNRAEQARYAGELDETSIFNLSVVEPAEAPFRPMPGKRTQAVVISGGLWLLLGALAAFVRDFLDPTVKSASQAQRCAGLPVIAEIPA